MNLIKGDFLKSLVVLLSGTVIAQLLNVAFMPILSRVYTPDELGVLGFYLQIVTFLTAVVTLRLELSFPMEKHDEHRYALFRYSLRWALILSLAALIPILIIVGLNNFDSIFNWMFVLIPLGVLLHGLFNLGMYWELGAERFRRITFAKLIQSGSINGLKLVFGLANFGPLGLISSVLLGISISLSVFAKSTTEALKSFTYARKSRKTKFLVHKHRDLYFFNLPHVLVDLTRDVILASFIISLFGQFEFGSYSYAYALLKLPSTLIGAAVGQALFAKCSNLVEGKQELFSFVRNVALGLAAISLLPFVTIYFYGTEIFTFVLGDKWVDAGSYSEIITWWVMIIFITAPFSILPVILNRQRSYFIINVIRTLCLIGAVYIPYYLNPSIKFETSLGIIALTQIGINVLLLIYFVYIVKEHDNKLALSEL